MTTTNPRIADALRQLQPAPAAPEPTLQPMDRTAQAEAQLMEARMDFGRLLHAWQRRNDWSQDAPARIAIAAGYDGFDVHNSQWSEICRAKLEPKPKFFAALAVLNGLLADPTWLAAATATPRLLQDLHDAAPLLQADGTPWGAADFFAAYIGA